MPNIEYAQCLRKGLLQPLHSHTEGWPNKRTSQYTCWGGRGCWRGQGTGPPSTEQGAAQQYAGELIGQGKGSWEKLVPKVQRLPRPGS